MIHGGEAELVHPRYCAERLPVLDRRHNSRVSVRRAFPPLQDDCLRIVPDVDADPLAPEPLGCDKGGGAASEGGEHHVTGAGAGTEDAFVQGQRLLGG